MSLPSRSRLEQEIHQLKILITQLSSLVDEQTDKAMTALASRDLELAAQVINHDAEVNSLRLKIELEGQRILATQGPVAIDLRLTIAAIHIAVELERIGDHAAGIARLVKRMAEEEEIDTLHKLPKMAKRARSMVQQGIEAFMQQDPKMARAMIGRDDKIDNQYNKLFRSTLEEMRDENYLRRATFLLWVGHNLERIGDRATNIAERVIFTCTGEFVEIDEDLDESDYA
jgi:phosphate transport system protein